jgi:glutathione S-transferase
MTDDVAVLWHLKVSSYNEKARWALDYKNVPHSKKAVEPGRHVRLAKRLAGTRTLPILELDGRVVPDSTEIIKALEERWPDPPLYPDDAQDRQRALELEDFLDEELGPYARTLAVSHMLLSPDVLLGGFFPDMGRGRRVTSRALYPLVRRVFRRNLPLEPDDVEIAFGKLRAAGERIRAERGNRDYLVGNEFTVADLTAAALLSPAVAPPEFPNPQPQRGHPTFAPLRAALSESGLDEWVREMYRRHRPTRLS